MWCVTCIYDLEVQGVYVVNLLHRKKEEEEEEEEEEGGWSPAYG